MTNIQHPGNEAFTLASRVADKYGRLALSRAAGEAATAERQGDMAGRDLWVSVVAYLREAIQESSPVTA